MENSIPTRKEISAVLFDIGGVLLRLDYREAFQQLRLGRDVETHAAMTVLGNDPQYDAFERGRIDENTYRLSLCARIGRDIPPEQFRRLWNGIVGEPFAELLPALKRLRTRARLFALTNSNATHIASVMERFPWFQDFEAVFSSHELGLRKPEPEIYQQVLRAMKLPASAVLFFDDRNENVAGATSMGMHAHLVTNSPNDILTALRTYFPEFT